MSWASAAAAKQTAAKTNGLVRTKNVFYQGTGLELDGILRV